MTTQTQRESLQQLNETVSELAAALAASERRYASIARIMRWGGTILIVLVLTAVTVSSGILAGAYASQGRTAWWPPIQDQIAGQPPALMGVMQELGSTKSLPAMLVKIMQSASAVAQVESANVRCGTVKDYAGRPYKMCHSEAAVEDLGDYLKDSNGNLPEPPNPQDPDFEKLYAAYMQEVMEGITMAGGQAIVDAAVLVHRLRRDSDYLRRKIHQVGGPDQVMRGIESELNRLNIAMAAVPAMANEMNVMNRQMSVMSYSVGSTMGRMGSIMPW